MPGSETDLANAAFSMIREDPIHDLNDPDDLRAAEAKRLFEFSVRDATLRSHDWNCVRTRREIASVANPAPEEWLYAWQLPNDPFCLAARALVPTGTAALGNVSPYHNTFERLNILFAIEGRTILTLEPGPLKLVYTYQEIVVGRYDSLLFDAMATRLAAEMSFSRTGNFKHGLELMDVFIKMKTPEAAGINETEGIGARMQRTPSTLRAVRNV